MVQAFVLTTREDCKPDRTVFTRVQVMPAQPIHVFVTTLTIVDPTSERPQRPLSLAYNTRGVNVLIVNLDTSAPGGLAGQQDLNLFQIFGRSGITFSIFQVVFDPISPLKALVAVGSGTKVRFGHKCRRINLR